jgi:hypothetical protein
MMMHKKKSIPKKGIFLGRYTELPPPSPGGAASSATRGRTAGGAQPWRPAELPPSPASARPVSRTHGCLLLVGPSVARPAASSSSAGLDAWIHAQSCSMTLSEHRKREEVRVVHVRPKAMCVHPQRSRFGTSSAHRGRLTRGPSSQRRAPRACATAAPQINFCIPLCSLCLFSDLFSPIVVSPLLVSFLINFHLSLSMSHVI